MNWHKLFPWLAAICTLLFAGVWGCSLWYRLSIHHGHAKHILFVERGTIGVQSSEHHGIVFGGKGWPLFSLNLKSPFYPAARPKYHPIQIHGNLSIQCTPASSTSIASPLGTWKHERTKQIHQSTPVPMYPPFSEPFSIHDTRYFPLWFPWLTVIAAAFAFRRLMERRSASGKERKFAARNAAGRLVNGPA